MDRSQTLGFSLAALGIHNADYLVSYLFFLAALLWLVATKTAGRITFVGALDAFAVML